MPQDGKKLIFDRIQSTENHFGEFCTELSSFTKKKAILRDKYDDLSRVLKSYGDDVQCNETLSKGLLNYSKAYTLIGDVKDLEVQRLQTMIVRELAGYESVCKNSKEILKHSMLMRDKELTRKHQMELIRQRTQHRKKAQGENEQPEQPIEETKSGHELEANILNFERQKLCDIRKILIDFTLIQLKENAKIMEILTTAYNDLIEIDIDKDLNEFNQKFLNESSSSTNGLKTLANRSQSMSALNTNSNLVDKPKQSNLSNSTFSLDTARRNGNDTIEERQTNSSVTEDSSETEDETSTEADSADKQSSENEVDGNDDDNDVEVCQNPKYSRAFETDEIKKSNTMERRSAPTPQVRFSKLATQK